MSDNEEVSLIRTKKCVVPPKKETQVENPVDLCGSAGVLPKKQRPPKTEKQLEASKKMLEARRLQCEKIKEEKLAKQYEAYKKKETTKNPEPKTIAQPSVEEKDEEEEEEEEEEIIVIKKPKAKPKPKKKIVIVQQSDSEEESEEEEQPRQPVTKPKIKQDFGKSQQNSKSKINVGNQNKNWDNYFC